MNSNSVPRGEEVVDVEVRRAEFAGSWYPGNESDCRSAIEAFAAESAPCPGGEGKLVGGIVPHAGWYYSGRLACNVIECLNHENSPDTCIIFGRHLHPGGSNFIMKEGLWATPLGEIEIDAEIAGGLIAEFSFEVETTHRYEQDNTIELQLPFIKYFFPETRIVPIGLPPKSTTLKIAGRTAEIAKSLGRSLLVIGSTDLTHYGHNYGFLPKGDGQDAVDWVKTVNDKQIVDLMALMDGEGVIRESLKNHNACCSGAAAASIAAATVLGARRGEKILYSTSYDIRPDSSFVGYVGMVFQT